MVKQKSFIRGIIDIGSHSVKLDIFEQSKNGSLNVLECLSKPINLGADTFSKGSISAKNIVKLSEILTLFCNKLNEYGVSECRTVATSAIREAFNKELLINRIKYKTNLNIQILEAQDEAKIIFVAMRKELKEVIDFDKKSGIALIIGTGSLVILYFHKGLLQFSEDIPLGTIRPYEELGNINLSEKDFANFLETTNIAKRLNESIKGQNSELTLIGIGGPIRDFLEFSNGDKVKFFKMQDINKLVQKKQLDNNPSKLMNKKSCASLFDFFLKRFNFKEIISPAINTRLALIDDWSHEKDNETISENSFLKDMQSMADYIGNKYNYDATHAKVVRSFSLAIFDKLASFYNLDKKYRICMDIVATLHDIGRFVDSRQHHKHSFYLISNTPFPGLNDSEKRIIATTARYHRKANPKSTHPEYMLLNDSEKVTVLQLAGILRVADALAKCTMHSASSIKLTLKANELTIYVNSTNSNFLEKIMLYLKGNLFNDVFGLKLNIEKFINHI